MNLLSRLRRRTESHSSHGSNSQVPVIPASPEHPHNNTILPFNRKIHPDLNALAAQLSPVSPVNTPDVSRSAQPDPLLTPLTPWIPTRPRAHSNTPSEPASSPKYTPEARKTSSRTQSPSSPHSRRTSFASETRTDTSHGHLNQSPTPSATSLRTSVVRRLANISRRSSPPPGSQPPSAWSTFGRRGASRKKSHALPHASDFGGGDLSNETSRMHSRSQSATQSTQSIAEAPVLHPDELSMRGTPDDSEEGSHYSWSPSHSRRPSASQSKTRNSSESPNISSPSSKFTFGRSRGAQLVAPPSIPVITSPIRRANRPSLKDAISDAKGYDSECSFDFRFPRPAISLPTLTEVSSTNDSDAPTDQSRPEGLAFRMRRDSTGSSAGNRSINIRSSTSSGRRRKQRARRKRGVMDPDSDMPSTRAAALHVARAEGLGTPTDTSTLLPLAEPFEYPIHNISYTTYFRNQSQDRSRHPSHSVFASGMSSTAHSRTLSGTVSGSNGAPGKGRQEVELEAESRPSSSRARASGGPSTAVTSSRTKPSVMPATPSRAPQTSSMLNPASASDREPLTPRSSVKGKRKADEVEGSNGANTTPPDVKKQRATFAADTRPNRVSGTSSQAPSSYTRKRARLSVGASSIVGEHTSTTDKEVSGSGSRPPSRSDSQRHAGNTGTWSSRTSRGPPGIIPFRTQSRVSQTSQHHSTRAPSGAASTSRPQKSSYPPQSGSRAPSRRGSISQASIPISALISPHAPSISTHTRAMQFHMRDPRKPRIQPTPWTLALPQIGPGERLSLFDRLKLGRGLGHHGDEEQHDLHTVGWTESGGSPLHAWLFFVGFVIFPVWWIAAILGIPRTRRIGGLEGGQDEKKMALDDPQVEHDANSWRKRCRVMAVVSVFTYIPFIVLVAIFA
ncbi:hypothetical protein WG66_007153 [Moniliophthora roreri]|uniref:Uncharacterized protein n=1 Tax=Moniliophthora roreri TaxID=221103 RepID=A0A0W0FTZ0_MONRR|nr:hypothetical protein WG66_007153 [Moniliophthora roreri]